MGVGAFACYKLDDHLPRRQYPRAGSLARASSRRPSASSSACRACASRASISRLRRSPRSSSCEWCFIRIPWLYNYNVSASIEVPTHTLFGIPVTGPTATPQTRYLIVLTIVAAMTWLASNLMHGRIGRTWMAVRDMDIAAELIGIRLYPTKLLAFAVSSFYCGVAGAMLVFLCLGNAESESFSINQSFPVLFMVIIGGLGSLLGSFFGAALIFGLPIMLRVVKEASGSP